MTEGFDFDSTLQNLGLPFYIRKLNKLSSWGDESDDREFRLKSVLKSVFPLGDATYSFFIVKNPNDLASVVAAKNLSRKRPNDQFDLIAFLPAEFERANIRIRFNAGSTGCRAADRLHLDADSDDLAFSALCSFAFESGRKATRIQKKQAKVMVETVTRWGCSIISDLTACQCDGDATKPQRV